MHPTWPGLIYAISHSTSLSLARHRRWTWRACFFESAAYGNLRAAQLSAIACWLVPFNAAQLAHAFGVSDTQTDEHILLFLVASSMMLPVSVISCACVRVCGCAGLRVCGCAGVRVRGRGRGRGCWCGSVSVCVPAAQLGPAE